MNGRDGRDGPDAYEQSAGDPFALFDGAYVLGALAPDDRAAFEEHLSGCDACARAVREMAGLPGLLAQAAPEALVAPEAPPPELLPALLARVAARRRRRALAALSAAGVVLAACLALVFTVRGAGNEGPDAAAMTPLGPWPVSASVSLADAGWGTRVDMECAYGGARAGDYLLVAVGRDGGTDVLARWHALPENTATLSVGTALSRADIASLEIRTPGGSAVLRMTL